MTFAQAQERLREGVRAANARSGAENAIVELVDAIERFPQRHEDVPAYFASLSRLAPEMRHFLESILRQVEQ